MSDAPKGKRTRGGAVRTTITLNPSVDAWAEELRIALGHNSLSDLIADLIRRKKEEHDKAGNNYPPHRDQVIAIEEKVITPPLTDPPKPKVRLPGKHNN